MDNTTNTERNKKVLPWAFIIYTPVSKTSTITYLGLGNKVRVIISIRVRFRVSIRLIR